MRAQSLTLTILLALTGCLGRVYNMPGSGVSSGSSTPESSRYQIAMGGENFTCSLNKDTGGVKYFGDGGWGQLGQADTADLGDDETVASIPDIDLGGPATHISAGYRHACAVINDGDVVCWGEGSGGKLGYGNTNSIGDDETPASAGIVDLGVGVKASKVAASDSHTCALLTTGAVKCWGQRWYLGSAAPAHIGDNEAASVGANASLGDTATDIVANRYATCALLTAGGVICWGEDWGGDLGQPAYEWDTLGDNELPSVAGPIGGWTNVAQVAKGEEMTCFRFDDGTVKCLGDNGDGELGRGDTVQLANPALATNVDFNGKAATYIMASDRHACAALEDNEIVCWGNQWYVGFASGQDLGDNESVATVTPIAMPGPIEAIVDYYEDTCVVLADSSVYCWGFDDVGELGQSGGGRQVNVLGWTPLQID